ncbi:MAG: hypothetical protein AB2551_08065 [Candidatus Thiodiazotropha sp.]
MQDATNNNEVLKVYPAKHLDETTVDIPSSKPETQRAIITAALAQGKSVIRRDLRCSETSATKNGVQKIGALVEEYNDELHITGVGNKPRYSEGVIDCKGSGFAFRTMSVISSFVDGAVILSGDKILRSRIMDPLFKGIRDLGGSIETICNERYAPIVNYGSALTGSKCRIPGDECSQFTTAFLLGMPLTDSQVEIAVEGKLASASYVKQTIEALKLCGVSVGAENPTSNYSITPSKYNSFSVNIGGDYTSASYIVAIATLFKCRIIMKGLYSNSHQGEQAIMKFAQKIGLDVKYDDSIGVCTITNSKGRISGNYEIDVLDCPNILPTLAAIGSYINGSLKVTGGRVTNFHKSPRIVAMIRELSKMGVRIIPIYQGRTLDGFTVYGSDTYKGGVALSSWSDHRIFLSLFIASLRTKQPNLLDGYKDVHCSFPDFFKQANNLGLSFEPIKYSNEDSALDDSASFIKKDDQREYIGWL